MVSREPDRRLAESRGCHRVYRERGGTVRTREATAERGKNAQRGTDLEPADEREPGTGQDRDGNRATDQGRVTDQERIAERLLRSTAARSYDPELDINWAAPPEPDKVFLPPHRSSLYGTSLYERLSSQQRRELGKHEAASVAGTGIWLEFILRHPRDLRRLGAVTKINMQVISRRAHAVNRLTR